MALEITIKVIFWMAVAFVGLVGMCWLDLSVKYLRENARERIYQEEMQPVLCTREEVM